MRPHQLLPRKATLAVGRGTTEEMGTATRAAKATPGTMETPEIMGTLGTKGMRAATEPQEVPGIPEHLRVRELGQLLLRLHRGTAAGDARHDGEHVALAHRRVGGVEVTDVGVVEIEIDEVPEAAVLLHQVTLEAAMGRQ